MCNFVRKSNLSQAPGSEHSSRNFVFAVFPGTLNLLRSQFEKASLESPILPNL